MSAPSDASEDEGKANRSCYEVWHACKLMMVFDASQIYLQHLVLHFRSCCRDKPDERCSLRLGIVTTSSVCRTPYTVTCLFCRCVLMRRRCFRLERMWLLVRETNGERFLRQWSLPYCCLRYQFIKLGHLCARQCVSNYIRYAQNMSNNDSIVIVCRRKIKQRTSAIRLGKRDEPCCHKSTTVWMS